MKTILHFANQDVLNTLPKNIIYIAHLVTYSVPCMNGEYTDRAVVYKNRAGNQGACITLEQLSILQDCVLNDKPQPEFMKSQAQKAQDVIKRLKEKDDTISFYKSRLAILERDLFPSGYVDCHGLEQFSSVPLDVRFARVEKIMGVVKSPGGFGLDRLENVEFWLKNIVTRLNILDAEIYPTIEDVYNIPNTITLEGRLKRLEEKLGISGCVTRYGNLDMRLEKIESAWNCTKTAIDSKKGIQPICTIGKYIVYQDTSDLVLMPFKGNVSKFKVGDTIVRGYNEYIIDYFCNYRYLYHFHRDLNVFTGSKEFIEINFRLKETPYVCPVLKHQQALQDALQDAFGKKAYVPKYQVGDVLEFHNESCVYKVTRKITGVGLLIKTDPNTPYYNLDNDYRQFIPCEQVDKDTSIFKVNLPVAWQG